MMVDIKSAAPSPVASFAPEELVLEGRGFSLQVSVDEQDERLVVKDWQGKNLAGAAKNLLIAAAERDLSKVIFFATREISQPLLEEGMEQEGIIPGFFAGEDALCLVGYTDPGRKFSHHQEKEDKIITALLSKNPSPSPPHQAYSFNLGREADAEELAALYQQIFATYPTPVDDPEYLAAVIREEKYVFMLARDRQDRLAAAASAELHPRWLNAEITDCATGKNHRAGGLMLHLVNTLGQRVLERGYLTLFSLARAGSWGINKVFRRAGYRYTGRLINNCHICGRFENMNIWVRQKKAR